MTSKLSKHKDGTPCISFYETGKGEIKGEGFTLSFEAVFEMEQTEHGWVMCAVEKFERITINPDSDVPKEIPYPQFSSLTGWTDYKTAENALMEAMEDCERRANAETD
jgi:hypothetical protein